MPSNSSSRSTSSLPVAGAGGDDDGPRLDAFSGAEVDAAGIVAAFELYRLVGNGDLDPELLRLVEGPGHSAMPEMPVGKPR